MRYEYYISFSASTPRGRSRPGGAELDKTQLLFASLSDSFMFSYGYSGKTASSLDFKGSFNVTPSIATT